MSGPARLPLSVATITRNEADRLPACLASVAFAAETVVVDGESTDNTVAVAKALGARVIVAPWQGFGVQKQRAMDACQEPWILLLDADERLPAETAAELAAAIANPEAPAAFSLPRKNLFAGRWIRHGGWWPDRTVRLFRKGRARMAARLVHEALEVDGPVAELSQPIVHDTNRDLAQVLEKINRYSSLGAAELFRQGRRAGILTALFRALWAFVHNYLLRAGFLDGPEGLVIAVSDGVNTFYKYAKLREAGRRSQDLPAASS
ncbi:MAG: glycosyltransferase family 2 protein [Thermodesulfobacteriota bacterium]